MDVLSGNVRILCDPLITNSVFHFISSQIMFQGDPIPGLDIQLDGFVDSVMSTEDDYVMETEQ
jgi:hypothetical protein